MSSRNSPRERKWNRKSLFEHRRKGRERESVGTDSRVLTSGEALRHVRGGIWRKFFLHGKSGCVVVSGCANWRAKYDARARSRRRGENYDSVEVPVSSAFLRCGGFCAHDRVSEEIFSAASR
jgi:hypothetical protein